MAELTPGPNFATTAAAGRAGPPFPHDDGVDLTMAENISLLEFVRELLTNTGLRDWFAKDPEAALHSKGLDDIDAHDVRDALTLVNDDHQEADFSRTYDTGSNHISGLTGGAHHSSHSSAPEPHGHETAAEYVNRYITNNYVDDRDTTVDNSTNQQIDTQGGDFDQDIDVHSTVASGDGAVAAGGDISGSTVTTGNDNQVGDGNVKGDGNVVGDANQAVTGDGNTTSFGEGNATSTAVHGDVSVGDGAAFASGGGATVDNADNSLHNVGNELTDNSVNDSFKDSSDQSVHDSGNQHVDTSTNDSNNEHNELTTSHSFNDESDNSVDVNNSLHHVLNVEIPVV
jgi:hypothetical protein